MSYFIDVFGLKKREKLLRDELYVMLMLQRSEEGTSKVDCEDAAIAVACALDSDKCPAECKEDSNKEEEKEDTVVKSGDLEVSIDANKGADAFLYGGVSDLDTLTFKASEEGITVTKVTLERYGYSSTDDVDVVWLENAEGTRITDPKELNSKDQVTLSILKDYRTLKDGDTMTVVLQTYNGKKIVEGDEVNDEDYKAGSSIGFKVINIETSAANVDSSDIKGNPYLYDLVSYNGSDVILTYKGKTDTYHIGEGPYEVFRFKLKASNTSAAIVKGFTVTNIANNKLDLKDFVDGVTVTANDEKIKNVTYTIDDDEITVNFDDVEIGVKETAIFAMNIELSDDFDEYESAVLFTLEEGSDLKVTEKKTGARVNVDGYTPAATAKYTFNGSKITLSNNKLGTVNMPAGSDDVVVAEGTIDLGGQSIVIAANTITVKADHPGIEAMKLVVEKEEFDAKCTDNTCVFNKKMTIEKGGKLQLVVDIDDDATPDSTIKFTVNGDEKSLLGKTSIGTTDGYVDGLTYEESKDQVLANDFVGSITLYNLKVTAAKASLENTLTKAVEFKKDKTTSDVTVFEGTYTAKKQDLTLTDVYYTPGKALQDEDDSVTLNLYVDSKLVASTDIDSDDVAGKAINDSLTRVKIAAGESAKVEVKADVYAVSAGNTYNYNVEIRGEDADGNEAGKGADYTVDMKFVSAGTADVEAISNSTYKQKDVLLRTSNIPVAAFRVSSSNGTVDLDTIKFELVSGIAREHQDAVLATCALPEEPEEGATLVEEPETWTADNCKYTYPTTKAAVFTEEGATCALPEEPEEGAALVEAPEIWTADNCKYTYPTTKAAVFTEGQDEVAESTTTPLTANDFRVKINGQNIDEEDITPEGDGVFTVNEIGEEDIGKDGIEVVVTLKGTPAAAPYTLTLINVNGEEENAADINLEFSKYVVPALLTIEQKDLNGSTEFKFTVDKYENSNNVSNVCFYKGNKQLGCVNGSVSNGTTLEIEGESSVVLVDKITYKVAGLTDLVEISKDDYNDYFKVGSTYLKVFKAD